MGDGQDKIDYFSVCGKIELIPDEINQIKQLLQLILNATVPVVIIATDKDFTKEDWYFIICLKKKMKQLEKIFSAFQLVLEEVRDEIRKSPSESMRDFIKNGGLHKIELISGDVPFEFDEEAFCDINDNGE